MNCRFCNTALVNEFVDLGMSPAANSFLSKEQLSEKEGFFPLKIMVCHKCYLVQIDEFVKHDDIFTNEYVYFSSFSASWLKHAKEYTDMMTSRFGLNKDSMVIEIASNDGYLLQYFKEKNISVLGIEPTANTAEVAKSKGIDSIVDFFGADFAQKNVQGKADLILGNNVLAHVPDINDFVRGVKIALKPTGVNTFEFPHLCKLVEFNQFDTIYHEHYSYLSLTAVKAIFENQGLEIFDVQEISTHGGSLRIFTKHTEDKTKSISQSVDDLLKKEEVLGVKTMDYYQNFQLKVEDIKTEFLHFLKKEKDAGKKIIGYGAAAKGNTFLNFCGIKGTDLIDCVVDMSPHKQGKYLPGTQIPVVGPDQIEIIKPDLIVIFAWNLKDEIKTQLSYVKQWNAKFVTAIPNLIIFD